MDVCGLYITQFHIPRAMPDAIKIFGILPVSRSDTAAPKSNMIRISTCHLPAQKLCHFLSNYFL